MSSRREAATASARGQDDLRTFLRNAPPMTMQPSPNDQETSDETVQNNLSPPDFLFRRNVSRDFASMEISHKRFPPPVQDETERPE